MTILVTGATGTVGRHLVDQLHNKGERVRAVSRNPVKADLPVGVEVVQGDLTVSETMKKCFQGIHSFYLIVSSDNAFARFRTDPKIIEIAKEAGVKRVTLLLDYEGNPIEQIVQNSGMEWTILKPVEFMGNVLVDWKDSIRSKGIVREPFGDTLSARVHEADIAGVAAEVLTKEGHHGKNYYLTGPEALSRVKAVEIIAEVIGKDLQFIELTEEQAKQKWIDEGYKEEDIEFFVQMGKNPPEIGYSVLPSIEQVTGKPPRTFEQWVSEHKNYFI
jgi:uncharacterized protein YbjT (DUF2867 family)